MYIFKWKRWNKFENQLSEEGIGKKEEKKKQHLPFCESS